RGVRCGAEAKSSERVAIEFAVLINDTVVRIAAFVLLIKGELQTRAARKAGKRIRAFEYGALPGILQDWQRARGPAAFVRLAIDCVRDAEARRFGAGQRTTERDLVR